MAVPDRMPRLPAALSTSSRFADRVPESEALRASLVVQRSAIDRDAIDGQVMNNVLVFFGFAGVGKSMLSFKLEEWVDGRDVCTHLTSEVDGWRDHTCPEGCHQWGPAPTGLGPLATVRWNLRAVESLTNPVPFYLQLRRSLAAIGVATPRFDVGVVAMATKFRPNASLDPDSPLHDLATIANERLTALFPGRAPAANDDIALEHRLLQLIAQPTSAGNDARDDLARAVAAIQTGGTESAALCEVAAWLGWLLSKDLQALPPSERPIAVVFIDTFEDLLDPARASDERVVNAVVGTLPYCLFVITGRRRVTWDQPRVNLGYSGPSTWPSLARTRDDEPEPRQHSIGTLHPDDARMLLEDRLQEVGVSLADGLCDRLAESAQLPIHIDAIVTLASNLTRDDRGRVLTDDDLGGALEHVLDTLIATYPPVEARLLQAAALAAQFDGPLLARMAGETVSVAERFLDNPLIQRIRDKEFFQYHLHDEVRRIVLDAADSVQNAWSAEDRRAAAKLGLDYLEQELARARDEDDSERRIVVHATGYRLALLVGLEPEWVLKEFVRSPSRVRVRQLLGDVEWGPGELVQTAHLNSLITMNAVKRIPALRKHIPMYRSAKLKQSGRLWLAYALRDTGDFDAAMRLIQELWDEQPKRTYAAQRVVTCLLGRRFSDAVTEFLTLGEPAGQVMGRLLRDVGWPQYAVQMAEARRDGAIAQRRPRRWITELQTAVVDAKGWAGTVTQSELEACYREALLLDRKDGRRHYWMWRALAGLFDDDNVAECWRELDMIRTSLGTRPNSVNDALLLVSGARLLATGEAAYADLAVNDDEVQATQVRVPAEFLWEHLHDLGLATHRLTIRPTQWIGDRQAIKERWIAIFQRIIDEARQIVKCTGPDPSVNH